MNRVFKTKWSAAHQQYVVTDEHHATKGKASKSAVALAVAAFMMAAGAQAAYVEPGFKATSSTTIAEAQRPSKRLNTRRTGDLPPCTPRRPTLLGSTAMV